MRLLGALYWRTRVALNNEIFGLTSIRAWLCEPARRPSAHWAYGTLPCGLWEMVKTITICWPPYLQRRCTHSQTDELARMREKPTQSWPAKAAQTASEFRHFQFQHMQCDAFNRPPQPPLASRQTADGRANK